MVGVQPQGFVSMVSVSYVEVAAPMSFAGPGAMAQLFFAQSSHSHPIAMLPMGFPAHESRMS
jgi:hypothetical protein